MPAFEKVAVAGIGKAEIQGWIRDLQSKGLSPGTIKHCYRILRSIFDEAVDLRLIAQSPCRRIALPRIESEEHLYLEPSEVRRLAEAIDSRFKALVLSAAYLGCRWGELVGLKRSNLNLEAGTIRIVGTLEEVSGIVRYVEETKTAASRRSLTLPRFLVEVLTEHLGAAPPSEFVFVGAEGGLLRRNNFRRRCWKPAVRAAGLDERLRFHDLRHTCASILIAQGAHPKEIQSRLGHSSIKTTMDRYGHLMPDLSTRLDNHLHEVFKTTGDDQEPNRQQGAPHGNARGNRTRREAPR